MPTRQDIERDIERLRLIATSPTVSTITPDSADLVWVYDVDLNRVALSTVANLGGGGAPTDATYITQTPNATLTNEQAMSALATGLVKNTTGTGVLSIAVAGTDYAAAPTGSNNQLITDDGFGGLVSESGLTFDGTKLQIGTGTITPGGFGGGNALVRQQISDTTSGKYPQLAIQGPTNGGAAVEFYDGSGNAVADFGMNTNLKDMAFINRMTSGILQFYTHNGMSLAPRIYINPTGLIGIGTTSPVNDLHVSTANAASSVFIENRTSGLSQFVLANTSRTWAIRVSGSDVIFRDATGTTDRVVVKSSGALLQNTTTAPTGTVVGTFQQGVQAGDPIPAANAACWFVKDVSTVGTCHLANENGDIWSFAKQTALTTQLTTITHTAPVTPDYALQDLVDSGVGSAWGFATKDEGNTLLSVVENLQARVAELESKLQTIGALA